MRIITLLLICSLFSCGSFDPKEFVKPLRSDSKLAYTVKQFQTTTCKESCLVEKEYWKERCWEDQDDGSKRCVDECPLDNLEFHCIDLQKETNDPRKYYVITPDNWQRDVKHLFGYYAHTQIKRLIAQPLFICEQDFAICENHFEPIKALERFLYKLEKEEEEK